MILFLKMMTRNWRHMVIILFDEYIRYRPLKQRKSSLQRSWPTSVMEICICGRIFRAYCNILSFCAYALTNICKRETDGRLVSDLENSVFYDYSSLCKERV